MPDHELRTSLAAGLPEGYALQAGDLGGGGFGRVYPVAFSEGDRTEDRAVKVLTDYGDPFSRRSFIEEGAHLANLSEHPNIITVFERGDFTHPPAGNIRVPFITMERAVCSFDKLPQGPKTTTIKVVNHLLGAIDGMAHVHNDAKLPNQDSLLHRDLKPGNLLLGKDGRIKVTDFGTARFSNTGEQNPEQTKLIRVLGTAEYMDADSFRGKPSRASDIYALGVLGYKALSGVKPLVHDASEWPWHTEIVPPMSTDGHTPGNARLITHLDGVIQRALAKDPGDRQESMTELGEEIRDAVARARGEIRRDTRFIISNSPAAAVPKPPTRSYTGKMPEPGPQQLPPTYAWPEKEPPEEPEAPKPNEAAQPDHEELMVVLRRGIAERRREREEQQSVESTDPDAVDPKLGEPPRLAEQRRFWDAHRIADPNVPVAPTARRPRPDGERRYSSEEPAGREAYEPVQAGQQPGGLNTDNETHYGRRMFLGVLGVGALTAAGIFRHEIADFFSTPDPEKTASPEQLGTDYIGKNIVEALLDGQTADKQQAGAILRDLARLSPNYARDRMLSSGPRWDFSSQFYNRLFIENPDDADKELERFKQQNYTWNAVALMATFAGGYAMIEKPSIQQEKDRLHAHDYYANVSARVSDMQESLTKLGGGADTTNWRQLLASAIDPDGKAGVNNQALPVTLDNFIASGDYASAGVLGVALAAQKPEIAAQALERTASYALQKDDPEVYGFVRVLADGMAPYEKSRASVIEQMKRINAANKGDAARETTNHMAVSVGPFDVDAVIEYVGNNMQYPDAQLAMLVVGDKGQKTLQTLKAKVAPENQIWYELAIDPTKRDVASKAIDALKANPALLRRSGAIIGAALVNGRRFADVF